MVVKRLNLYLLRKGKDSTSIEAKAEAEVKTVNVVPQQRKLPATRLSETHKFTIAGHQGFLTHSIYDDGTLAEIFIRIAKQGSTLAGLLDTFAISVSMALQHGVPLKIMSPIYTRALRADGFYRKRQYSNGEFHNRLYF